MADIWFNGPVANAVTTVTENNLVFLVFIYDASEESKQLEKTLLEETVVSVLKQKTVALKMKKDSENANMFAQLYPISQVPIVYFILKGTIKDFGVQDLTSEDIVKKVNALYPNNQAREKLEEIRKKRAEEEKMQAREREIKRREDGKLAQETRQKLQDEQTKAYLEKARKEKKESEEYKRKVKEQIAKDRANQIAARKAEKEKQESEKRSKESNSPSHSSTKASYYDHSNLNIKQLDGSSLRHSFSSSDTLASVSQWIDSTRTDGDMPFKLFAQFPNRNFDIGDEQRTLLDLKLCPSGTLIMKPIKNATSAYGTSSNSTSTTTGGWMNYLYSASGAIYNSVNSAASYLISPTGTPEHGQRLGGGPSSNSSSNSGPSFSSPNKPRNNINTLNSDNNKKDDDDRQTYNGNSVNQE